MRSGGFPSAAPGPLVSGRSSRHPKIWQLHGVPCWDHILLEIFERSKPACMGYVSACSPSVLVLNMSPSPDGEQQIYHIVHRDPGTETASLLKVLFVELRSFEQLFWALKQRSLLDTTPSRHAMPVDVAVESPDEHRRRSRCPFCHGSVPASQ